MVPLRHDRNFEAVVPALAIYTKRLQNGGLYAGRHGVRGCRLSGSTRAIGPETVHEQIHHR